MADKSDPIGESMSTAISHLLEECRMVLPGIQALFGFQLMAVFNQGFWERLDSSEQRLHLLAVVLVVLAVALVMTPAAYHRQAKHDTLPERFISLSSRLLLWSMFPLMAAICVDFYVIARMILLNAVMSLLGAFMLFIVFVVLWLMMPRSKRFRRWLAR
jgi:phage shock protein PspC (stress-responsive transcriptional regulator)